MADILNIRPRPGVRINLHPSDIAGIVKQPEVIASFTQGELTEIVEAFMLEINYRTNQQTEK